ncbi:MAG: hypothetical protein KDD36_07085 [Flavobacteriales bacterium]|nr:hypothetical protein [Flavobacteriales bacterium]
MKKVFQPFVLICAITSVLWVGCKSERAEKGNSFESADAFFDQHKQEEQTLVLDTGGTGPIIGKMGTRIYADSSIFMDANGNDVSYPIILKLIELYPAGDILLYRTPTIGSGGQLLRSGGEIKLTAYKDGQALSLKPGKNIPVDMPSTNPETGMTIFSGSGDPPTAWTDHTIAIQTTVGYYQAFPDYLGWINCDKLYSFTGDKTNIQFEVDGTGGENIALFVVFDNFLSVLTVSDLLSPEVPVGETVTIIGIAMDKQGNYRLHQSQETIATGMTVTLDMQEKTEQEVLDAVAAL